MNALLSRILARLTAAVTQTPAGGEPPVPPRTGASHHLPGLTWTHDTRYRDAPCGCFEVVNYIHNRRHRKLCHRHAFEAEWEARLRETP